MPRFPKKEADIAALAERLYAGLAAKVSIYPRSPVRTLFLRLKTMKYLSFRDTAMAKQAFAQAATATKDEVLADLGDSMKADIRYAENTVDYDDEKLKLTCLPRRAVPSSNKMRSPVRRRQVGWAGRKAATPLAIPGQARATGGTPPGRRLGFLRLEGPHRRRQSQRIQGNAPRAARRSLGGRRYRRYQRSDLS